MVTMTVTMTVVMKVVMKVVEEAEAKKLSLVSS
jgi:hypothetical protein